MTTNPWDYWNTRHSNIFKLMDIGIIQKNINFLEDEIFETFVVKTINIYIYIYNSTMNILNLFGQKYVVFTSFWIILFMHIFYFSILSMR